MAEICASHRKTDVMNLKLPQTRVFIHAVQKNVCYIHACIPNGEKNKRSKAAATEQGQKTEAFVIC